MERKKILIIDDDAATCREVKKLLSHSEYEILSAFSGEGGLKRLKIIKPDLILLDLILPDVSGFKIAQQIKLLPHCEHIPIIAISLKREAIDRHVALKSGIIEYVEKPIDYSRLSFLVKDILEK